MCRLNNNSNFEKTANNSANHQLGRFLKTYRPLLFSNGVSIFFFMFFFFFCLYKIPNDSIEIIFMFTFCNKKIIPIAKRQWRHIHLRHRIYYLRFFFYYNNLYVFLVLRKTYDIILCSSARYMLISSAKTPLIVTAKVLNVIGKILFFVHTIKFQILLGYERNADSFPANNPYLPNTRI